MTVHRCPEYEYEAPTNTVTRPEAMAWFGCAACNRFVLKMCEGPVKR